MLPVIYSKYTKILLFSLFLSVTQTGQCCINEYKALLNGDIVLSDSWGAIPKGRFNIDDKDYLLQKLNKADSLYKRTKSTEDYSDLGAMLVYTGQYVEAKRIFLDIEQHTPGLYQTASNLGTTYELLGQNDSALYWIKRAIAINPHSHEGSEWIHVKILEAKLKANGDDHYFLEHHILPVDFGDEKIPESKTEINLDDLRNHLYYQLNERMSFIKPKDPIIAQLLFELGNVSAMTIDVQNGLDIYRLAKEYGYSSELFAKRRVYFEKLQTRADFRNSADEWLEDHALLVVIFFMVVVISVPVGLVWLIIKKRKKRKQASTNS